MRKQIAKKLFILVAGLLCLGLFALAPKSTQAANPTNINFQGKVVNADGTNVSNGTYTFIFRLYDASSPTTTGTCASNASCWWEETDSITVTNGVFQVELGSGCAFTSACNSSHSGINFNSNNALYLTMKFNGDSAGFMSPTVHLTSSPYAFNADNLGGFASSAFSQLSANNAYTGTNNFTNASATAFTVASSGSNYGLQVDESTASAVTGLKIKAAAAGGGLALSTLGGTNEALTIDAKGTGTLTLQSSATGDIQFFSSSFKITSAGNLTVNSCTGCGGGGATLQTAYNGGAGITTTSANDVTITLASGLGTATALTIINNHISATKAVYISGNNASGTVTDGLLFEQTGAGTTTSGIEIKRTAGALTNGLTFTGTFGTNLINSASFVVNASGAISGITGITFSSGALNLASGGITNAGSIAGATTYAGTSTSATALTVASTGSNYGLQVDESTASAVTGLKIKAAAGGGGLALSTIGGNTDENLTLDAKGAGTITIGGTSTGGITLSRATTISNGSLALGSNSLTITGDIATSGSRSANGYFTNLAVTNTITGSVSGTAATVTGVSQSSITSLGTLTGLTVSGTEGISSTSATAFTVASSGSNYGLQIDESTASAVTGLKIKAAAAGGGLALSTINGNAAESLTIDAKGTGTLRLQSSSTGDIEFFGSTYKITSSGALTVVSLTAGGNTISDFTGDGLTVASGALTLNLQTGSGLAVSASGLSLDRTCGTNQILKWSGSAWACADDGGAMTHISGTSGAAGSDMTTQVLTADSSTCTTTALCSASMSTTGVGAGKWKFRYTIYYQSAATTTGIAFGVNHTGASSSLIQAMWYMITTGGAAATGIGDNVAATNAGQLAEGKSGGTINAVIGSASAGVATANTTSMAVLEGTMSVTNSGTLELKIASEVASSAVKLMTGTSLELYPL